MTSAPAPFSSAVSLGDRMKAYETAPVSTAADGAYVLPADGRPLVARIDGHSFSTFTRGFEKPFDARLSQAMVRTAADLLEEFQARTAYTQSDEITLVFVPIKDEETGEWREWPHRGRLVKLCTLLASYAGVRFNYHLVNAIKGEEEKEEQKKEEVEAPAGSSTTSTVSASSSSSFTYSAPTLEKIYAQKAHFDARLFAVANEQEAYNNIYWRMWYDCARNSVHGLAMCHFSTKQLHGKNRNEMKQMLHEKEIDYEAMPPAFKYGTFAKKHLYSLQTIDKATGKPVEATRSRVVTFCRAKIDVATVVSRYLEQQ